MVELVSIRGVSSTSSNHGDSPVVDRQRLIGFALMALLVLSVYVPALSGGFVWDDITNVTENTALRSWQGLGAIWFEPGATQQYYPLTYTSLWFDYHLWGLKPFGYHLVNIILQIINASLLWLVLRHMRIPGAYLAAAIFAAHPVQVESVVWITERKNLLSTMFYMGATLKYLRFDEARNNRDYAWATTLFGCALFAKTVTCTWPVIMGLLLVFRHGRLAGFHIKRLVPLLIIGIPFGLATAWLEVHHAGSSGDAWSHSLPQKAIIAGRALWFYAGKLLWPNPLMLVYPRWTINAADVLQYVYPVSAAAVPTAAWLLRRKVGIGPLVAVCGYGLTVAPALGFFNVYFMRYSFVQDHFQYVASIFIIVLCVVTLHRLSQRLGSFAGWIRLPAVLVLLVALAGMTWRRSMVFHNAETLWRDTIAQNPDAWVAHHNLGAVFLRQDRYDQARLAFAETLRIEPEHAKTYHNLGMLYWEKGDAAEAARCFNKAFELDPRIARAAFCLGVIRQSLGDADGALAHFFDAVKSDPKLPQAHYNIAVLLDNQGEVAQAVQHYRKVIALSPDFAEAHHNLAIALYQVGDFTSAWRHVHAAERLGMPLSPQFRSALTRMRADPLATQPTRP